MAEIYLTRKELAEVAGYTYRRLYDIDAELPDNSKLFVKGEGSKCDLALFVQRWVQYNVDKAAGDECDLDQVKAEHERVKTRKTQLEVARMEGALIDLADVRKLWGDIANTVMQSMLHLPSVIAPMVMMMDDHQRIADIIDREIRQVLNQIADTPVPDYAAMEDAEEDEEV